MVLNILIKCLATQIVKIVIFTHRYRHGQYLIKVIIMSRYLTMISHSTLLLIARDNISCPWWFVRKPPHIGNASLHASLPLLLKVLQAIMYVHEQIIIDGITLIYSWSLDVFVLLYLYIFGICSIIIL